MGIQQRLDEKTRLFAEHYGIQGVSFAALELHMLALYSEDEIQSGAVLRTFNATFPELQEWHDKVKDFLNKEAE